MPWPRGTGGALLLAATGAVVVAGLYRPATRAPLIAAALIAALIQMPVRSLTSAWPPAATVLLVACDVGQGDGLFIPLGGSRAIVVDTGPEPLAIDRCLRQFGIDDITLLVLTHFHDDHVGGITVRCTVAGWSGSSRARWPNRSRDTGRSPRRSPAGGAGARWRGPARCSRRDRLGSTCSARRGRTTAPDPTRTTPRSCCAITVRGVRLLMTGDAEVEAQNAMLAAGVDLRADVLKVPHHGSAYSARPSSRPCTRGWR